ncbi:MAG: hypothetical protein WC197_04300 [Candidatus Gastranaerophilaceae bacterium]|jgi:hypothetical protein
MSYKNDSMLVVANKFGKARGDACADLFETYDKIRDISVGGTTINGAGMGGVTSFLTNIAKLIAPSSYMPTINPTSANVPGTSYSSAISGGTGMTSGGTSSLGIGNLGNFPGFPTGEAASITTGIGSAFSSLSNEFTVGGIVTGEAASIASWAPSAAGAAAGAYSGFNNGWGSSALIPVAGIIGGFGNILTNLGPYMGPMGLGATLIGNLAQGYGGSTLGAYQSVTQGILNNADVTLGNKVKNIETVVKMLDTQGDVVRKMLKDGIEADSKLVQNI